MGLWTDRLLPRLIDRQLHSPEIDRRRAEVCSGLAGTVLELGFGSGLNLPHLPATVGEMLAVEPSPEALRLAGPRIAAAAVPVRQVGRDGARLDLADTSVDAVLSTFTLCTVPDVEGALAEVRRVLRPGGALHFLEHGLAPEPSVRRWQRRLHRPHAALAGGCHLDRPIDALIAAAGLPLAELSTGYGEGPRPFSYLYAGRAVRHR
jgi:ubiquinone/menaquinone biosynthesis C-methylase UbiE